VAKILKILGFSSGDLLNDMPELVKKVPKVYLTGYPHLLTGYPPVFQQEVI